MLTTTSRTADENLAVYGKPQVVGYYEQLSGLQPVEEYLFTKYVRRGSAVVDIGVGGGRTTPWLSAHAGKYLGIDYSEAMVSACKARFPALKFMHGDATDLSFLSDLFDVVVFSFNGIDCISSDSGRLEALRQMRRALKTDGAIIFSSHNAKQLAQYPSLAGASASRRVWRSFRALARTPFVAYRALRSNAFFAGCGYVHDPVHGGLRLHVSTPESITRDAQSAGLSVVEVVGGYYPAELSRYLTSWYYYVLRPLGAA